MAREKVKSLVQIDSLLESSEFKENQNDMIIDHLKKGQFPYCGASLYSLGNYSLSENSPMLVKSICSLSLVQDKSKHMLSSFKVVDSVHLIVSQNNTQVRFYSESGFSSGDFVYDEE